MPVDVGIYRATKPQDMAIERWLNVGSYEAQSVVDLAKSFEPLPVGAPEESDENAIYTIVSESQVRVPTLHRFVHDPSPFLGTSS